MEAVAGVGAGAFFKYRKAEDSDTDLQQAEGYVARKFDSMEDFTAYCADNTDQKWYDNPKLKVEVVKSAVEADEELLETIDKLTKQNQELSKANDILVKQVAKLEDEAKDLGDQLDAAEDKIKLLTAPTEDAPAVPSVVPAAKDTKKSK